MERYKNFCPDENGKVDFEDVRYWVIDPIKALAMAATGGEISGNDADRIAFVLREKINDLDQHFEEIIKDEEFSALTNTRPKIPLQPDETDFPG